MWLKAVCGCLAVVMLSACTTAMGKANKLLEAGLYQEATKAYERILEEDPDNADAKIGLAKARSELWRKELISIRLMRMSGDGKGALERLEELLEKIRQWDVSKFQSGELVSAEEEVRNGRRLLASMIQQKISDRQPLVALKFWNDFDQVREAKQFGSYNGTQLEEIRKEGRDLCERLKPWVTPTSFSFNTVAKAVCAYFGGTQAAVAFDYQKDYRFSKVVFNGVFEFRNFEGSPTNQMDLLLNQIEKRLEPLGLYASESPYTLTIAASGSYMRNYDTRMSLRTHPYTVRVPYQDFENYEEMEFVNVYRNGQMESVQQPVQKTRPVTRFRMEQRSHRYQVTEHNEKLRLDVTLTAKTTEATSLAYVQEKENTFVTHQENRPEMGLVPMEGKLLVVSDWLSKQYSKFAEQFVAKLAIQTGDRFCQASTGQEADKDSAENFSRCAELNPENVAAIAWFTSRLGLTRAEALRVLGHKASVPE